MVVASSAVDSHAEEQLASLRGQVQGLLHQRIETRRRAVVHVAGRGHQSPDEPVVGHVPPERVIQPARERIRSLVVKQLLGVVQVVAPVQRPEIGVLGPIQEAVDDLAALLRVGVRQKLPSFLRGGDHADRVEVHPAEKGRVVGHRGWRYVQLAELPKHVPIDRMVGIDDGDGMALRHHADTGRGDCSKRADKHRGLAPSQRFDLPRCVDLHHRVVMGLEVRQTGEVGLGAVGKPRRDEQLHAYIPLRQHDLGGVDDQGLQALLGGRVEPRSGFDPSEDRAVCGGVLGKNQAPAMRFLERWLAQQQAVGRIVQIDAAALVLFRDHRVVFLGVVTE